MNSIKPGNIEVRVEGELGGFKAELRAKTVQPGLEVVTLTLTAPKPEVPKPISLNWVFPGKDIQCFWAPQGNVHNFLYTDWNKPLESEAADSSPVCCLFSQTGANRLTFACSDALHYIQRKAGLREETGAFICALTFFTKLHPAIDHYEVRLRLDTRDIPYYEALREVQEWWAGLGLYPPCKVPSDGKLPMYSTWYSFHQAVSAASIEKQCALARELGFHSMTMDDGWETEDEQRGYAFAGDWQVSSKRIPDMAAHVAKVHQLGMKYLLWFSISLMGKKTKAYQRFKNMALRDNGDAIVLDPRFPEVREYLAGTLEHAVRDWKLDGLKLDFVDSFATCYEDVQKSEKGQDFVAVTEATDRLMTEIMERVKRINPELLVEFRQGYVGPVMRKYGNMFRAADCPYDLLQNRQRTLDIRLLVGKTAVHADPMMWNYDDPVEAASLQFLNSMFGVPQVSMLLDKLSPAHLNMVRWCLSFWRENVDVLMDGNIKPLHPEVGYPMVTADTAKKRLVAVYGESLVVNLGVKIPVKLLIINATGQDHLVLEFAEDLGQRKMRIFDCQGRLQKEEKREFKKGIFTVNLPSAGVISCDAC